MNALYPVRDRILVRPIEESNVTAGGLILPTGPVNGLVRGVVIGVGDGPALATKPLPIKIGDVVHYPSAVGVELEVNRETVRILAYDQAFMFEREVNVDGH